MENCDDVTCVAPVNAARFALGAVALVAATVCTGPQSAQSGTMSYSYPQIRGAVVDDATGQPLAGVSVIGIWAGKAVWALPFYAHRVIEVSSTTDGRFVIPAWSTNALETPVSQPFPVVMAYTHGFRRAVADSKRLQVEGQNLRLQVKRLADSPGNRVRELREMMNSLLFVLTPLPKEPVPRMLKVLDDDWQSLPKEETADMPRLTSVFEAALKELRPAFDQAGFAQ